MACRRLDSGEDTEVIRDPTDQLIIKARGPDPWHRGYHTHWRQATSDRRSQAGCAGGTGELLADQRSDVDG